MNAAQQAAVRPERGAEVYEVPSFLRRLQPARFGWYSDRTLAIQKGDQRMILDADDLAAFREFLRQFEGGATS